MTSSPPHFFIIYSVACLLFLSFFRSLHLYIWYKVVAFYYSFDLSFILFTLDLYSCISSHYPSHNTRLFCPFPSPYLSTPASPSRYNALSLFRWSSVSLFSYPSHCDLHSVNNTPTPLLPVLFSGSNVNMTLIYPSRRAIRELHAEPLLSLAPNLPFLVYCTHSLLLWYC